MTFCLEDFLLEVVAVPGRIVDILNDSERNLKREFWGRGPYHSKFFIDSSVKSWAIFFENIMYVPAYILYKKISAQRKNWLCNQPRGTTRNLSYVTNREEPRGTAKNLAESCGTYQPHGS